MYDVYETLYKQYRPIYGPNTAIFLMVGGFYELYDIVDPESGQARCNTREIADILNIRLTVRKDDVPTGYAGLFWGFPVDALHKWAGRLTDIGWTVVVVDQQAEKVGKKLQRKVARILSPGTHIENNGAAETRSITGVYMTSGASEGDAPVFGAAAFDLSTGITVTTGGNTYGRGGETWKCDELAHFITVQGTAEIVFWWAGDAVAAPSEEFLRRQLNYPRGSLHFRNLPSMGALAAPHNREEFLRDVYNIQSLLPVRKWLSLDNATAESALVQLLLFIKEMNPSTFQRLHMNRAYVAQSHMILGNNALSQLQVVAPRLQDSVLGLFQSCITPMGRRGIRRRLLIPITDSTTLQKSYTEIREMQVVADLASASGSGSASGTQVNALGSANALAKRLREIYDLPRLHRRLICSQITADDICSLYQSYLAAESLSAYLPPSLQPPPTLIDALRKWRESVFDAEFSVDKASRITDDITYLQTGPERIQSAYMAEQDLAAAAKDVAEFTVRCKSFANVSADSNAVRIEPQEIAAYGIKATPVAAKELERAFKPGGAGSLVTAFRDARVRMLKSTGWVEAPWLSVLNERVGRQRAILNAAVQAVLPDICGRVASAAGSLWDELEAWIERVDITRCLAIEATARGYVEPQLCEPAADGGAIFSASNLRHPLIESIMTRTEYISHNVQFDGDGRGWLVYGMNASGKSSLMKAIGIAIHLAQCGCFVPATACQISPFTGLYTRIVNRDDLWAGMSSFAVEMSEMREFLDTAGRGTMILGDELCNGTESQSAKAIVAAGIDWLADRHARYFFATHLHGLLDILPPPEELALKVWHLRVEYDALRDRLIYQRSLRPGPGSTLYGLEVARAMHLPVAFLEKAHKYRRALLGTVNEEEATGSAWNTAVVRRVCEICKHEIVRDLEVHHIRPRVDARMGDRRFADGAARDDMRNLIVVCQRCHDAHHAGDITIGPLQQTSAGPERIIVNARSTQQPQPANIFQEFAYTPPATTTATTTATATATTTTATATATTTKQLGVEEVRTIIHVMKQYPALSIRQLAPKLRNDYEIEVEESVLRKIKRTGAV